MRFLALLLFFSHITCLPAGTITVTQALSVVLADGTPAVQMNSSSAEYFTTVDANGEGTFGWTYSNTSGAPLLNALFLGFVDLEFDSLINGFTNEYGDFVALAVPPSTPLGGITAYAWEIDEPGFFFGDIVQNLLAGMLDNTNSVPFNAKDDVGMALGFSVGTLQPLDVMNLVFTLSRTDIGGLRQSDDDSPDSIYWNGYVSITSAPSNPPPGSDVPEPASAVLALSGLLVVAMRMVRVKLSR